MPCESFQSSLTEAAAGAPASPALRSHLIACAECRAALAAEEALFAAVDAGLRVVANSEVPASLIPSVHAHLVEQALERSRLLSVWAIAGATLAAAIVVLSVMQIRKPHVDPRESVQQVAKTPVPAAPGPARTTNSAASSLPQPVRANRPSLSPILKVSDRPQVAGMPLVIVPPDEREAFARFLSTVERQPALAASLARTRQPETEKPVTADPIVIAALEVKPLDESVASSESNEK